MQGIKHDHPHDVQWSIDTYKEQSSAMHIITNFHWTVQIMR